MDSASMDSASMDSQSEPVYLSRCILRGERDNDIRKHEKG